MLTARAVPVTFGLLGLVSAGPEGVVGERWGDAGG